ncbi:Doublesex- and mab-3-related transcription factor C1 [Cricetulus griseus]|uniref:Doublesex-and mab-3-related transcription factor C1 n=1 Tax=Cricetulus griseus TaxID=10029 RepID=G3IKJ1_CRIGR|nr:Doublesex- and mab-3-related transcription factor C1 [Cricetulus griseus]
MATAPKSHMHVKKLTVEEGVRTGKNMVHQLQAQVDTATQEESPQGPVLLSQSQEQTSVPYIPETMGQQLMVSFSGEPYGSSAMPSIPGRKKLVQTIVSEMQGPSASDQASVYTTLEWQEMLEAAEALLALKNSSQTRHQPCGMPGQTSKPGGTPILSLCVTLDTPLTLPYKISLQMLRTVFLAIRHGRVSNVVLQPCINTIPPVLPAQVLVSSNICLQGRGNANLAPGNSTQISDASNQGREICTQLPDASNQGREICTQINDASNQGPEVYTQIPAISNQRAVSAEVDRQKVLDAAEALLILHNSPQAWEETRSIPGSWLLE